jgi:pimeloyl-ACP methyl ester carboxylesterase
VVRACVDIRGQIITMVDRAYLTEELPMLVLWGSADPVIPALHADTVRRIAQSARVEIVEGCGHFPHKDRPEVFVDAVRAFIDGTTPATYSRARWRALLKRGVPSGTVIPDSRVVTVA